MREETKDGISLGAARIVAGRPRTDARADRFPDSVETGWSWVAAALAIGDPVDFLRRPADRRGRAQADRGGARQRPLGHRAGRRTGLGRDRLRRHSDGLGRRSHRGAPHGDFRRADDRTRPRRLGRGPGVDALSRARAADRLSRRRCALPAAADLCQPLVRPQARHRAGPDLVRPIHRRGDLADRVSALARLVRLAVDDAVLCARRGGDGAAGAVPAAGAVSRGAPPVRRRSWFAAPRRWGCGPIRCRDCCARPRFCAACRWRCRPVTW